MAAGLVGVLREAARLDSSDEAFAEWSLTFCATGPITRDKRQKQFGGRCNGCEPTIRHRVVSSGSVCRENVSYCDAGARLAMTCENKK